MELSGLYKTALSATKTLLEEENNDVNLMLSTVSSFTWFLVFLNFNLKQQLH
jgi:hypothetical protein